MIRYDNHDRINRIMLFISDECIEILASSNRWHFDGTFKICPILFKQVFTIHAVYKSILIACAYMILPKKDKEIYLIAFTKLKEIIMSSRGSVNLKVMKI